MMERIKGYDRASILDLALASGGSLDCLMEFASANSLSLTDEVEIGREYDVRTLSQVDEKALRLLNDDGVRPATALSAEDMRACPYGGIGYMGIEIDFEVS